MDRPDSRATRLSDGSLAPQPVEEEDAASACLVVICGPDLGRRMQLGAGTAECGRSLTATIPLEDESVSRRHARFVCTDAGYVVMDLGSTNGTYVNDVGVSEHLLGDGDQIKLGRTILKFIFGRNVEQSYYAEIYRLMTFDGLTQVRNQRAFEAALEREVIRSQRERRPLCLAIFDLDHFKRVNDECGHLAGDAVLRQLAAVAAGMVRPEDVFARVGGEEFALILPETPIDEARAMLEKLRRGIAEAPYEFEARAIPVTVSIGVAELPLGVPIAPVDLYSAADQRLYDAKRAGRNRVA